MTVPAIRANRTPALADDDNKYDAVQQKLTDFAKSMDAAKGEIGRLFTGMRGLGDRAHELAERVANANLDPTHVEMINVVCAGLGGATGEVSKVNETARDVAEKAHAAQATHSKLYGALNEARTGRRETTPRPGFFVR